MSTIPYLPSKPGSHPVPHPILGYISTRCEQPQSETHPSKDTTTDIPPNQAGSPTEDRFFFYDMTDEMKVGIKKTDKWLSMANLKMTDGQSDTLSSQSGDEVTASSESRREKIFWPSVQLKSATIEDIIDAIRIWGFDTIAERLKVLHETILEEQEEKPIVIESLQNFAQFIHEHSSLLPNPTIVITPDGFVQTVWRVHDYGTLVMNFLPSTDIMFAAIFTQYDLTSPRRKISGVLPPRRMMRCVEDFVDKLNA